MDTKKILFFLFPLCLTTSCTNLSIEDRFLEASTEISCLQKKLTVSSDTTDPLELEKKEKELQEKVEHISQKYDFSNREKLDTLAKKYMNDAGMKQKLKEKIKKSCP